MRVIHLTHSDPTLGGPGMHTWPIQQVSSLLHTTQFLRRRERNPR